MSRIACENQLPGDPTSDWFVSGAGDPSIQGFGTSMSVNAGSTISFKIKTPSTAYHIDILRTGYYQGNGARKVVSHMLPSASLPQSQPACLSDASTGLVDCGNWGVSASWTVPADAVSGVYVAHLMRDDAVSGGSQIIFVVRNDSITSDIVYQTADTTWEAYNEYGGNSLYVGNPVGRAYKVSYNRPFDNANGTAHDFYFDAEYPLVRFMESNGYDVTYISGGDVDRSSSILLNHDIFVASGHDEYWSGAQRAHVEAARDAGVNLAFFSGNEVFWKTRWEPSIDGTNTAYRTLVSYKDTHANAIIDPSGTWTGSWRDPRFSPPEDGGRPENALTGQFFIANAGTYDMQVPSQYSGLRFWRNTAVARLAPGQTVTLAPGTGVLGYEWDEDADNGFRPTGLIDMSSTTASAQVFTDYGNATQNNVNKTHHLTLYKAPSGALVFGAGTVQWAWGLDSINPPRKPVDVNMQQATMNLFADMHAQPATPISGLVASPASSDTIAPTSTITSPTPGATIPDGTPVTISGTATDSGGGVVAGVEVSTDGGTTWHPATGTSNWTYSWIAHGSPSTTIRTRASDDSANVESPRAGTTVNVGCPCSIWGSSIAPANPDSNDGRSIEVGMRFKSDAAGFIRSIRFYKAATNTGTHTASLWTTGGQLLGTATFTGETASGWQQADFASPIAITANTTYIASYHAPSGHYSEAEGYFYGPPAQPDFVAATDSAPLHALHSTQSAPNGLYVYSGSTTFPTNTFNAENYWVDVVYSPSGGPVQVPGVPTNVVATAGPASATVSWNAPTTGGPPTAYTVTPFIGSAAQTATTISGSPPATSVTVGNLTNGTSYTFKVTASNATGSGTQSAASNAVVPTPPPAPGSPTNVTATAGSQLASVSWSAPTTGGPPTSYTVTPFIGSSAQTPTSVTGSPPSTSTVVNGLTNGTTYTFRVTASNDAGSSAPSSPSNAVTPTTTPPIAIDKTVSADGVSTVSTPAFSTNLAGDLVVAFVSADGAASSTTTTSVTGGGLTWTLDQRGNSQPGTTEVWHANSSTALTNAVVTATSSGGLDMSLTVVAFSGASGIGAHVSAGARTGAPSATLTTVGSGSLVYAVGNDYDHAIARTPDVGESIVHQWVDGVSGDTFWVQSANSPTGAVGSSVTMNDTAPTTDRWNFTAVEIRRPASGGTTSPQSISFGPLANATLSQSPVSVSATASSGLPVSFSSLTGAVCSVAGTSVSLLTTGTCTIQADQPGNVDFDPAAPVQQSFTVSKNAQTITFTAPANATLSQSPVSVSATASSGLPVSFSSTTTPVCTVSGSSVTLLTPGTCTIQADQAGNGSFNAAPAVQRSFTVSKNAQTITFGALPDVTLAQSPRTVSATSSSGLTVSFSSTTTSVCTVSGTTVTLLTTGICTIQADQAGNGSFNAAAPVQQSFSIVSGQGAQTITFSPIADATLAQSPLIANATASSGLPVSFSSLTTSVCTVSGSSIALLTPGTCTIQADQAGNGSFDPAPSVQRSFTVSKSNQTIAFAPLSDATLAQSPVTVNATASSGLTVTFSSTTTPVCTVSGTTVTLLTIGTCTIQADQAGNASFNAATFVRQSFAVTANPSGITIDTTVSKDIKGAATTPTFSTATAGELLVAFVGSDGPSSGGQTMTVTGAGLTWTLVRRTNARPGDSEIWQARATGTLTNVSVTSTPSKTGFDQSLTVVAFRGASGVGASGTANAATGAPTVSLTTTRAGSWVFGIGNDWDRATARTVGAGQTMVHQWIDSTTGDTYWTQSTTAPTPASGTAVAISDTAPTADRWNLTSVEVLAT